MFRDHSTNHGCPIDFDHNFLSEAHVASKVSAYRQHTVHQQNGAFREKN